LIVHCKSGILPVVITRGNNLKAKRSGPTADQFVTETLALIEEKGGSHNVNLREISRRVGCAHTNSYNYFDSFEGLLWASYRKAIELYNDYLTADLSETELSLVDFRTVLERLARFPMDHPGLYRFIGSDPLPIENMPRDVMDSIGQMKNWFIEKALIPVSPGLGLKEATEIADILIAYISGESFDVINGRMLPDEDLPERIVGNALKLFGCLSSA
jgi:AcrR family transcriptional regulator